ncbi:MAG: hypothetical protein N2C14_15120 [Planctomycetales bacterium]
MTDQAPDSPDQEPASSNPIPEEFFWENGQEIEPREDVEINPGSVISKQLRHDSAPIQFGMRTMLAATVFVAMVFALLRFFHPDLVWECLGWFTLAIFLFAPPIGFGIAALIPGFTVTRLAMLGYVFLFLLLVVAVFAAYFAVDTLHAPGGYVPLFLKQVGLVVFWWGIQVCFLIRLLRR